MTTITSKLTYSKFSNLYCTPDDVARILQFNLPDGFTSTTRFTYDDVLEMIYLSMEEIDRITGHAWRERQLTKYEYHNIDNYHLRATGVPIHIDHRDIKQLDATLDDTFEIWDGSEWENFVTDKVEGRNNDYWLDYELGTIYLRTWLWMNRPVGFRTIYRYGEDYVNPAIKNACAKMVALQILYGEDRSILLPEGSSNIDYNSKATLLERDIENTLNRFKEWRIVDSRG